jgi:hypothetical protein
MTEESLAAIQRPLRRRDRGRGEGECRRASAQEFFSDDLNPNEVAERLVRMLCAVRHEELPTIQSASYRDLRAVARSPAWRRPRTTLCSYIVLAAAHPKRATEIIPLFSGNFAR